MCDAVQSHHSAYAVVGLYLGRYAPLDVAEQRVLDEFTGLLSPVETGWLTRSRLRAKASISISSCRLAPV